MTETLNVNKFEKFFSQVLGWWLLFWGGIIGIAFLFATTGQILNSCVSALFALWDVLFYYGITTAVVSLSVGVLLARNPINALFCLIGVFVNVVVILLNSRVEFLSMILLIVYIGAIAILFLFVIMLLNLRNLNYIPIQWTAVNRAFAAGLLVLTLNAYVFLVHAIYDVSYYNLQTLVSNSTNLTLTIDQLSYYTKYGFSDVVIFSNLLYTQHALLFLLSGMILLSSMIGAIVLAMSTIDLAREAE